VGAIAGIGGAIGLPLGGVLVDQASYHWIFWLSAAMGAVATVTTMRFVPESPIRTPGRLDIGGAVILAAGLSCVLIAISRTNQWGWGAGKTLGLVGAGLAILVAFVAFERRHAAPLINMTTLARRAVLTTDVATLLVGFGLFGTFILIPQMAQLPKGHEIGLGLDAFQAGLLMAPGGLAMLVVAPLVGRIGERVGSKPPLLAGCVIAAVGLAGLAEMHATVVEVVVWALVLNIGVSCAFAALPNLIVGAVDAHETGEATGVNTIARNVGASLGGQVAASVIAGHVIAGGLPGERGFQIAFLISAGVALAAGAFGILIPSSRAQRAGLAAGADTSPARA
jgi:MFS family permease